MLAILPKSTDIFKSTRRKSQNVECDKHHKISGLSTACRKLSTAPTVFAGEIDFVKSTRRY